MSYQFKRQPREHQLEAFHFCKDMRHSALLMRMRTGKSKVALDKGGYLYSKGKINAIVIVAPNGVHTKWIKDDVENDIPDYIDCRTAIWKSGNKYSMEECDSLFDPGPQLRILAMNIEAFQRDKSPAETFLTKFLRATDALLIVDESHFIGNPDAKRTQRLTTIGNKAAYKMILTGTPATEGPLTIYSQFNFLDDTIFSQSYTSFKHTYAELLPPDHPTMRAIMSRGMRFVPAVVARDKENRPIYKNLDLLKEIIAPYTYTKTLEECTDLPPTIYEKIYYELEPKQRKVYDELMAKARVELESDTVTVLHKLTLLMRLQQVLSGYLPADDEDRMIHLFDKPEDNPRIKALQTVMSSLENEQVIIWCRFVPEVKMLEKLFGDECVTYYGGTKDKEHSKHLFMSGQRRIFVGNVATGGVGLDFSGSYVMIFYSNTFAYGQRDQAEARQQFIGQERNILVIDIEAENTIDAKIIGALRDKKSAASEFFKIG